VAPTSAGPTGAILALDASGAACSVAVMRDGDLLATRQQPMDRGHAEALMPLVMEAMGEAGIAFTDLAEIAVGVGPGSFTGIRIALAAARGMALATGRPVVGIDSFSAVAAQLARADLAGRSLLVAIESKRAELFGQYFDSGLRPIGGPLVLQPDALLRHRPAGPLLIAGDGAARLPLRADIALARDGLRPDARAIARLAQTGQHVLPARPLYLRAADVTLPHGNETAQ
jgi:tRNA threonylcarbamoyladenosine biosynthesis protein TsaB